MVRRLDPAVFATLPARVAELAGAAPSTAAPAVSGYRIDRLHVATESMLLYHGVRLSDDEPVALRRLLDVSHEGGRGIFRAELARPLVAGAVRPLELIDDAERGPLLVLERLRGEPLEGDPNQLLDEELLVRLMRSAAETLAALHAAGGLHGDLRPGAVLRDRASASEITVLGGRLTSAKVATARGRLPWQSPEEVAGEAITAATDVYGLGLLLHHLRTGEAPGPLGQRSPLARHSGWSALDELIVRATAKAPAQRPSMSELVRGLDELLALREVPQTIGKWRLGKLIGEGAFGRVFAAENVDISGHRAAIKVLRPFMARDHQMRQRFLNEASLVAGLDVPGVVRILDGGVQGDGTCYIAMELLSGEDLEHRLRRGPLPWREAATLLRFAALTLERAHQLPCVHRDIKPSNLYLSTRGDGSLRVCVLDFGVALLRGEPTRAGVPYTTTGHVWGTPEYMSPEQWRMESDVDGRADIYSLGLVLWECLAGKRPFVAANIFEWQQAHLSSPLPSLSISELPPRLLALIERMTAKPRAERSANMKEVADELAAILDEKTAPAPEPRPEPKPETCPPPPPSSSRFGSRLFIGLGGLAAVVGITYWLATQTPDELAAHDAAITPRAPIDAPTPPPPPPPLVDAPLIPRDPAACAVDPALITSVSIDGDPARGPAEAPVTLIEISDFWTRIFVSQRYRRSFVALLSSFGPNIRHVFKLNTSLVPELSRPLALASCAAQRQDRFWQLYDRVMELHGRREAGGNGAQEAEMLLPRDASRLSEGLVTIASDLGLDVERFGSDVASAACAKQLESTENQLASLMIDASPMYYVNGRRIDGRSMGKLRTAIEESLAAAQRCLATEAIKPSAYYDHLVAHGTAGPTP